MKILLFALASLHFFVTTCTGLPCNTFFTESCLGEKDQRYDEGASINLKDQAEIWGKLEGLYEQTMYSYQPDYQPKLVDDQVGLFRTFPYLAFANFTMRGSRGYRHTILMVEHKDGPSNPGLVNYADVFITSTHEKDGSAITLPFQSEDLVQGSSSKQSISYPIGSDTVFGTVFGGFGEEEEKLVESITCLVNDCDEASFVIERFRQSQRIVLNTGTMKKMTEADWIARVNQAYKDINIPEANRQSIPMTNPCLSQNCPTDEDFWCMRGDPSCSASPYQEPDGKLKPGIIAAFVIVGTLAAALVFYLAQRCSSYKQAKRYRTKFAERVVDSMTIRKSMQSLSPDLLAQEFQTIDTQKDGRISKEELWEFLNTGKAGEINKHDFEALYAVMDTTDSGSVDFLEFCAFLANCHQEYDKARQSRHSFSHRTSRQLSEADIAARNSIASLSAKMLIDASELDMRNSDEDASGCKSSPKEDFAAEESL